MHWAAENGLYDIVQRLLDYPRFNALISVKGGIFDFTPLHLASMNGHAKIVRLLLNKGAAVHSRTRNGMQPIHLAAIGGHSRAMYHLLQNGADATSITNTGDTPLHIAAKLGHINVVDLLFLHGADVDVLGFVQYTPLQIACAHGHYDMVMHLILRGADFTSPSYTMPPIHLASAYGNVSLVDFLIMLNVPICLRWYGMEPIHIAARHSQILTIDTLLRHGANIDDTDAQHATALHYAVEIGSMSTASFLLSRNADANIINYIGQTPLSIALSASNNELATLLRQHGATI